MAQLGSALRSGRRGRGFKSRLPDKPLIKWSLTNTMHPAALKLKRSLSGRVRSLLSGSSSPRFVPDPVISGLFPSESIVRKVHADGAMLVGGIRALLLQSLHPVSMQAVADHSDYKHDSFGRLKRTVEFLGITTYGDKAAARSQIEKVKTIHNRVNGTIKGTTQTYSANDPHLLAWVHATEVDSFLTTFLLFGRDKISASDQDLYVEEMGVVARELGYLNPPQTKDELAELIESFLPELKATPESKEAAFFLYNFPFPGIFTPRVYQVLFAAAADTLQPWARSIHQFYEPGLVLRKTRYGFSLGLIRLLGWALRVDEQEMKDILEKSALNSLVF